MRRDLLSGLGADFGRSLGTTLGLSTAAAFAIVALGVPIVLAARSSRHGGGRLLAWLASLGYALPGTILAIGLLAPLAAIDLGLGAPALIGLGTGGALITAYVLRFLAVAVGATEAGLARIPSSLPDAALMLGRTRLGTLAQVQVPLASPAILSGSLLVFVECAKELPATLLLRPLNVETLATHLYGEAARGTYEDGAVAALLIVAVGLVPVALLARVGARF